MRQSGTEGCNCTALHPNQKYVRSMFVCEACSACQTMSAGFDCVIFSTLKYIHVLVQIFVFILRRSRRLMFISSLPFYVLVVLADGARFAHMSSSGQPSVLRCLITQMRSGTPADIGLNFFTVRHLRTPKFCLRNVLVW